MKKMLLNFLITCGLFSCVHVSIAEEILDVANQPVTSYIPENIPKLDDILNDEFKETGFVLYNPPEVNAAESALFVKDGENESLGFKVICEQMYTREFPRKGYKLDKDIKARVTLGYLRKLLGEPELLMDGHENDYIGVEIFDIYVTYLNVGEEDIKNESGVIWDLTANCYDSIESLTVKKDLFIVKEVVKAKHIRPVIGNNFGTLNAPSNYRSDEWHGVSGHQRNWDGGYYNLGFTQVIFLDEFVLVDDITAGGGKSKGRTGTANQIKKRN